MSTQYTARYRKADDGWWAEIDEFPGMVGVGPTWWDARDVLLEQIPPDVSEYWDAGTDRITETVTIP
jgi:hypothetical protein